MKALRTTFVMEGGVQGGHLGITMCLCLLTSPQQTSEPAWVTCRRTTAVPGLVTAAGVDWLD